MTKFMLAAACCAMTTALAFIVSQPVQAGACGPSPVMARGEQSKFVWLAKVKARALWRHKVRSTPGLGPGYANWARAQNTEERCMTGGAGTVCIFTGTPCLP